MHLSLYYVNKSELFYTLLSPPFKECCPYQNIPRQILVLSPGFCPV